MRDSNDLDSKHSDQIYSSYCYFGFRFQIDRDSRQFPGPVLGITLQFAFDLLNKQRDKRATFWIFSSFSKTYSKQ